MTKFLALALLVLASPALAEIYQGRLAMLGSMYNRRPFLKDDQGKVTAICKGHNSKVLKKLVSFAVRVEAIKKNAETPHKACLDVSRMEVTASPEGKPVLQGYLERNGDLYGVKINHKDLVIVRPGKNDLSEHLGKKVILDTIPKYPTKAKRPYKVIKSITLDTIFLNEKETP
ncbi:hypothetical protein [Pseudobacteriovorax antillogorgiicola]|uniref:Uncharacterized protein n=1 Tax=Pseudobacteriovorax antillogorgiicola TaxID=1513793 RepID=A0A1Y6CNS5_9BACT|nr:hypothetical protein [Pseudobacteriovorax antillogorgiicola]TCS46715.1 hypothetical protein EDD56_12391 [Pseudobacteriovorax antillogorgiicola]SMF67067.1 hypothetical protein SAMN06296036_12391 [Pseudobacteriovorax antillogorgiicola]